MRCPNSGLNFICKSCCFRGFVGSSFHVFDVFVNFDALSSFYLVDISITFAFVFRTISGVVSETVSQAVNVGAFDAGQFTDCTTSGSKETKKVVTKSLNQRFPTTAAGISVLPDCALSNP